MTSPKHPGMLSLELRIPPLPSDSEIAMSYSLSEQLRLLNNELPTAYRSLSSAQLDGVFIVTKATETIKGTKLFHARQKKIQEELEREVGRLKTMLETERSGSEETKRGVEVDRVDGQFCMTELLMYITGEGETRGQIDFTALRALLEKHKEGGFSLKMLAEEIESKFPVDKEVIRERREKRF